jgi:hypothetical protein
VTPARLVDTRSGQGAPKAPLIAGCTIAVDPNLPDGATAAVVNITTVDTTSGGFITPYPCASPKPWVSTVQTVPGRIVPGTTVVPLGSDGRFCLYSPTTTNVVVDLFGYYGTTGTGRYTPLAAPVRRFAAPVARGANVPVQVTGAGVPAAGVESVAVTVHATGAVEAGFVTISACESPRPWTSVLNVMPGQTVANHTHVRVSDLGQVCVFASSPMTVMLDVSGWFGAAGATTFRAVAPARAMDTRSSFGNGGRLPAGDNRPLPLWGRAGVPATGAVAVAATTTIVNAPTVGFLTVHACVAPIPNVSMVRNLPPWNSATMVLGATDAQGRWCLRAGSTAMDVLVDVVGWYGP